MPLRPAQSGRGEDHLGENEVGGDGAGVGGPAVEAVGSVVPEEVVVVFRQQNEGSLFGSGASRAIGFGERLAVYMHDVIHDLDRLTGEPDEALYDDFAGDPRVD